MVDKIKYSFSAKINIGNYESIGVDLGYETDIKEGESPLDATKRAIKFIDSVGKAKVEKIKKEHKIEVSSDF